MRASNLLSHVRFAVDERFGEPDAHGVVGFRLSDDGRSVILQSLRPLDPELTAPFDVPGADPLEVEVEIEAEIELGPALSAPKGRDTSLEGFERAPDRSLVPTGLHIGAALAVELPRGRFVFGAVSCLLAKGGGGHATHVGTAGHIFPENRLGWVVWAYAPGGPGVPIGQLTVNLLDSDRKVDFAVVEMNAAGRRVLSASAPRIWMFGVLPAGAVMGWPCAAFLPTQARLRAAPTAVLGPYDRWIPATTQRAGFWVRDAALTERFTAEGDSGTGLVTQQPRPRGLATLSGARGRYSVFQQLHTNLAALRSQTGRPYALFAGS